jgi:antitoxin ParD1/3/4
MTTMNISLPDEMKEFIDRQVAERGYGTSSEFLRDLIRREQERLHLRNLMLEAMASPRVGEAGATYFDGLRSRVAKKAAKPKRG